jgi:O-antigen/teichoic acid export membrane protein
LLSAMPSYLTFSDFGFTIIAKNEMLMQVAAGDRKKALATFHSVFGLLNIIIPAIIVISVLAVLCVNISGILNLGAFPSSSAKLITILLLLNVAAYQYFLLICGGVRCENRLAAEATWGACARLMEGLAVGGAALLGGNLVIAATVTLISRLAFCAALYIWLRRASPWIHLGHSQACRSEIIRLLKPAFAFMLMPISQAMLIQVPLMIVGTITGPVAVVTFSTTRTLTRVGTAVVNMLNGTVQGEYSVAFGRGDAARLRKVLRYHQMASMALIIPYGVMLYLFRKPLMTLYTHGQVLAIDPFFLLMILTIGAEMMWSSIVTPLSSINRHVKFAHLSLVICTLGMALCYVMTKIWHLNGAAESMLIVHLSILLTCYLLRHNITTTGQKLANA